MKFLLIVRFTNISPQLDNLSNLPIPLQINLNDDNVNDLYNVQWLKEYIRNKYSNYRNNKLRLIHHGNLLSQRTNFKKEVFEYRLKIEKLSGNLKNLNYEDIQNKELLIYIDCSIGDEISVQDKFSENNVDETNQGHNTSETVGFERLLQQGFTQQDIDDLRRQFYQIYNRPEYNLTTNNDQINDLDENREQIVRIRTFEDRWIQSTENGHLFDSSENNNLPNVNFNFSLSFFLTNVDDLANDKKVFVGILAGAFLGVTGILLIIIDNSIFTPNQNLYILFGVILNIIFGIVRGQWI